MADEPNVDNLDDLDAFEQEFFNKTPKAAPQVEEKTNEHPDDDPVEELDEEAFTEDGDSAEPDDDQDDEPEPEPKKKPKRSAQERIDELTREKYEQAREYDRKLADLEAKYNLLDKAKEEPKPEVGKLPSGAPDPNAEKDGQPVYPLGEFDPEYIRHLARFTINEENQAAEKFREEKRVAAENERLREETRTTWVGKLEEAEKELPDIREKINSLQGTFENLDNGYGQYLVDIIMTLDNGPQVLSYCADNPKEAREIVSSGPALAAIKLGRLDARLTKPKIEDAKRVSKAPPPAQRVTRGTSGQFTVAGDTDDLDAFEKEFFR